MNKGIERMRKRIWENERQTKGKQRQRKREKEKPEQFIGKCDSLGWFSL